MWNERNDGLFTGGEISGANAFMKPERGASSGDIRWANGDHIVIDSTLPMDFVVCVGAIPGFFAPKSDSARAPSFARRTWRENGYSGVCSTGMDCAYSLQACLGVIRNPAITMNTDGLGFRLIGRAEVFKLGVDDDLCTDNRSELGEKMLTPAVNMSPQVSTLRDDFVALIYIICGQFCKHLFSLVSNLVELGASNIPDLARRITPNHQIYTPIVAVCTQSVSRHSPKDQRRPRSTRHIIP